ncbi:MAG: cation diffusion facilitator family transporter [Halodesulfurarchaeum sp.]
MGQDRRRFLRAAIVNVLGNLLKIIVEGAAGLAFGSLALVADAAHSVADLLGSLVVLVWGRAAFAGPDADHPHGHDRIEPLTALFVGVTLIVLAGTLLRDAYRSLQVGPTVEFSVVLVGGLAFAILDMILVYWYTLRVNATLDSPSLRALAADTRNDVLTSMAAGIGVFGVLLDAPLLDPLAGALVSLLVLKEGIEIARENVAYLTGSAPESDRRDSIRSLLLDHPTVRGVHDLQVYYDGPTLEVEVHVEVDGQLTIREAHAIETELLDKLRDRADVGDAHVHLDPVDLNGRSSTGRSGGDSP